MENKDFIKYIREYSTMGGKIDEINKDKKAEKAQKAEKVKKVLYVASKMDIGGLEMMLMNFLRYIDADKVHIDFMLNYPQKGAFDDEIRNRGSEIFVMPRIIPKNLFKYMYEVNKFFKSHKGEYSVVHGHLTSVGIIYLTLAKRYGVKTRIIHAHYGNVEGNHYEWLERLMLKPLKKCAEYFFACSDKAGKFCFGEEIIKQSNYKVIKNGIDIDKFSYNVEVRQSVRDELGLDNKFVIIHIGRFEQEKNHEFIADTFCKYLKTNPNAHLLLVGAGSMLEQIKQKCKVLNISQSVTFLGLRNDVFKLLQAGDVFILPSVFEGLPVVGIEAQASGIKCLFSDTVTREVDITGNCEFLSVADKNIWIDAFERARKFKREKTDKKILESGYDVKAQAKWLESFYINN